MIDPLSMIFVPGGTLAAMAVFVSPLLVLRHVLWRREARRLNNETRCARCGDRLAIDALFLYAGAYHCSVCATKLRRRFTVAIPVLLLGALGFGVSSGTAFIASLTGGGPELAWWFDGRWIPLLLPSVGVAATTVLLVKLGKRANLLRSSAAWAEVEPGDVRTWHLFPGD